MYKYRLHQADSGLFWVKEGVGGAKFACVKVSLLVEFSFCYQCNHLPVKTHIPNDQLYVVMDSK